MHHTRGGSKMSHALPECCRNSRINLHSLLVHDHRSGLWASWMSLVCYSGLSWPYITCFWLLDSEATRQRHIRMDQSSLVYGSIIAFAGAFTAVSISVIRTNDEFSFILVLWATGQCVRVLHAVSMTTYCRVRISILCPALKHFLYALINGYWWLFSVDISFRQVLVSARHYYPWLGKVLPFSQVLRAPATTFVVRPQHSRPQCGCPGL